MFSVKTKKTTTLRLSILEENIMFCLYREGEPLDSDGIKMSVRTFFERSVTDAELWKALDNLIGRGLILSMGDYRYCPAVPEDSFRAWLKPCNTKTPFSLFIS